MVHWSTYTRARQLSYWGHMESTLPIPRAVVCCTWNLQLLSCWVMLLQACYFFHLPIAAMFFWKEVFNVICGHLTALLCMNLRVTFRNSGLGVYICTSSCIVPAFQSSCSAKRFTFSFNTRSSSHQNSFLNWFHLEMSYSGFLNSLTWQLLVAFPQQWKHTSIKKFSHGNNL